MLLRIATAAAFGLIVAAAPRAQDPPQKAPAAPQEDKDPFRVHIRMHRQVAPKVVWVRGQSQTGTGVIIRSDGLILTSPTACGISKPRVRVTLPGNRQVDGEVVGRRNDLEIVLLKIDAKDLPVMEFADSTKAKIGQVAYAFGDVWDSIGTDDQVAMSLGIVSGLYEIESTQMNSLYTGPVIETSAAVNQNLDGGPLVDAEGRMLGMITLNYHPAKFTGIAIPAHIQKPVVERLIKEYSDPVAREPGIVGIVVEQNSSAFTGVRITHVFPGSPAEAAKLEVGDEIIRIDQVRVTSWEKFEELTRDIRVGSRVQFRVKRSGRELPAIMVTAGSRSQVPTKKDY
jgi:serine protease Do